MALPLKPVVSVYAEGCVSEVRVAFVSFIFGGQGGLFQTLGQPEKIQAKITRNMIEIRRNLLWIKCLDMDYVFAIIQLIPTKKTLIEFRLYRGLFLLGVIPNENVAR